MSVQTDLVPVRVPKQRQVTWRGRVVPVVLPRRQDPRLRISAVILTLQVLGQTVLGFRLSIAQILVTIALCGLIDGALTWRRDHVLAWPASGILTGNSVAFILRASGTRHGDWWSLHGIEWFVLAGLLAMASKHLLRVGGRHLFNPSNVGLVWCLLVIGPVHVFPQYLWWGPNTAGVAAAFAVILVGGYWVLRSVGMLQMAVSFVLAFAVLVAALALNGGSFIAIWHEGALSGPAYWLYIALSPEVLIFVFFMMSDPQTAPRSQRGRRAYGAGTAALAAALLSFQSTEFGIKLAILAALTVATAFVPLVDRMLPAESAAPPRARLRSATRPVLAAVVIVAVTAPLGTAALARNADLVLIERGEAGSRNPQ